MTQKSEKKNPLFVPLMMLATAIFFMLVYTLLPSNSTSRGDIPLRVVHLDKRTFFPTVAYPSTEESFETNDVTWAVFFYKPYCGSCRRIKPAFEALARTVNATKHLRFADVNCVKEANLCAHQKVDKQPAVVIYKPVHNRSVTPIYTQREPVARWRGMLIAYELVAWFGHQQANGLIPVEVEWPEASVLADAILEFKLAIRDPVDSMVVEANDYNNIAYRTQYLPAIFAALKMSLSDAVFNSANPTLKGSRKRAMIDYLNAVSVAYPKKAIRDEVRALCDKVKGQDIWKQAEFEAAVRAAGLGGEVSDENYADSWCAVSGGGVGGYPCGMWLLFHTLMANADRFNGHEVLQAIHKWVTNFFGCAQCATHFNKMWTELQGETQTGHVDTATWLWDAHNRVRARLVKDDTVAVGSKNQWPPLAQCTQCYSENIQNRIKEESSRYLGAESFVPPVYSAHDDSLWSRSHIFDFSQEVFCFGSDTFSCSQFYDPSVGTEREPLFNTSTLYAAGGIILLTALIFCWQCGIFGSDERVKALNDHDYEAVKPSKKTLAEKLAEVDAKSTAASTKQPKNKKND